MRMRIFILAGVVMLLAGLLAAWPAITRHSQAAAAPEVFASPVHAGCYIAAPSDCRIHVESFTIQLATGKKLVYFKLVAIKMPAGTQTTIYDFRPDQSNPAPSSGTTYTPSRVAQDFAATCGATYEVSLQGQDTGDSNGYNLGLTGQFTCPSTVP
jgi:hypothetical protein